MIHSLFNVHTHDYLLDADFLESSCCDVCPDEQGMGSVAAASSAAAISLSGSSSDEYLAVSSTTREAEAVLLHGLTRG